MSKNPEGGSSGGQESAAELIKRNEARLARLGKTIARLQRQQEEINKQIEAARQKEAGSPAPDANPEPADGSAPDAAPVPDAAPAPADGSAPDAAPAPADGSTPDANPAPADNPSPETPPVSPAENPTPETQQENRHRNERDRGQDNRHEEDLEPDIIDPSFTGDFPFPETKPLKIGLVNQDADMRNKARFYAENRLGKEINEGGVFKKFINGIWKGGIARSYYRQKYFNEARRDMLTAQSLVTDATEVERNRYNRDISQTFLKDTEGLIDESHGDSRKSLLAEHPEIHQRISDIVSRYADGRITDMEDAKRQFSEVIAGLEDDGRAYGEGHLSSSNLSDVAIAARQQYENLMTVAETVNGRLEHDDAMARVMAGFDVLYGQRQMDRLTPRFNAVDRIVDRLESSKVGVIASPETIALATGAAACVGELFGKRLASSMLVMIPGLSGAIFAGAKAGREFEDDRSRAMYDVRYNREFDGDQKRRQQTMSTVYEHHKAKDVYQGLEAKVNALRQAQRSGADVTALRQQLLQATAECKYYLETDKTNRSAICYSNEIDAPMEQLKMLEWLNESKSCLREAGIADVDGQLADTTDLMRGIAESVNGAMEESDKTARSIKAGRIAKSAGLALGAGIFLGAAVQEVRAMHDPKVLGIFEKDNGDYTQRLTAGRKLANLLRGDKDKAFEFHGHMELAENPSKIIEHNKQIDFVRQQDGTYTMTYDGKATVEGLDWNSKTGRLTKASIEKLKAQGINVKQTRAISKDFFKTVPSTKTGETSIEDYIGKNPKDVVKVTRSFWYNNDTQGVFDKNELGCHYYTDPSSGARGFITRMTDSGSYAGNKAANFSKLAEGGKIRMMISATQGTQSTPIEVPGKLLPNGQMAFVPEPGSAASRFFDSDGKFIGRFAEVVQDMGVNSDGKTVIAPLATVVGKGFDGKVPFTEEITETVKNTITVPQYLFSAAERGVEFPLILPFTIHGAMNESRPRPSERRPDNGETRTYGYGYGYGNGYGAGSYEGYGNGGNRGERHTVESGYFGEVSPRIAERKQLSLGEETAWYRNQLAAKKGAEYVASLDNDVARSPELSNMSGDVKTVVVVPVWAPHESENVYNTLSLYSQQEGVDMNSVMFVLDLNWRDQEDGSPEEVRANIEKTFAEVERARRDFPHMKIATIEQPGHSGLLDVAHRMNDVVLMAINNSINQGRMNRDNDVVIVRNDVDLKHLNKRYIASFQEAAKANPKTPMFTGTTFFNIDRYKSAPAFGALWTMDRMRNLLGSFNGEIHTSGGNFAYRAAHFAAGNGFGYPSDPSYYPYNCGEDTTVGQRLNGIFSSAYGERMENSGNPEAKDLMDPSTRMMVRVGGGVIDEDDCRYLKFYARPGAIADDAYFDSPEGYEQSPMRPEDIEDFREYILDRQEFNSAVERFENEMNEFFPYPPEEGNNTTFGRVMKWWFGVSDLTQIYTFERLNEPDQNGFRHRFRFTEYGRERFLKSLISRIGTGVSQDARNSLQRAIEQGTWASPILNR